jgi:hypothetical protein
MPDMFGNRLHLYASQFGSKSDEYLPSHSVHILPGAGLMKAANPVKIKKNSFFGKMLALGQKVLE